MSYKKIAIVGAGLAGLSAAYRLLEGGISAIDVFESQPYVGGRVQSREVRGQNIDFGGFLLYPWYKETWRLLERLDLLDEVKKTPLKDIFYFLDDDRIGKRESDIPFSQRETLALWAKSALKILPKTDLSQPNLTRFHGATVADYLRKILKTPPGTGLYETYFDTVNQGYGYGPIDRVKMAFMAPIARQVALHGDITTTSFFPRGTQQLVDALKQKIVALGGRIHTKSKITGVDGLTLRSKDGDVHADAILFAQTVSDDLYRQIVPEIAPNCSYTHFVTAAVELAETPLVGVDKTRDWGAAFFKPESVRPRQVLSAINLLALYGNRLNGCILLNIVVRDDLPQPRRKQEIEKTIGDEIARLFPQATVKQIHDSLDWQKTMPVADEAFVETIRKRHGRAGYFFAGDFLGAPSIETAIATGTTAARDML